MRKALLVPAAVLMIAAGAPSMAQHRDNPTQHPGNSPHTQGHKDNPTQHPNQGPSTQHKDNPHPAPRGHPRCFAEITLGEPHRARRSSAAK